MISKVHVGRRLTKYRQEKRLSQAELAEQLRVTPQAVSKWERGAALPDIELLLQLSRLYGVSVNRLLEDEYILPALADKPCKLVDGVAYFVPQAERNEAAAWAEAMVREKWVPRSWTENMQRGAPWTDEIFRRMQAHGGMILEIGAGPGGGFMPCLLRRAPEAAVIVSDLSPTVVREWKRCLEKEIGSPNISYAVFNFCRMPLRDGTIDVVSDFGGIANTVEGEKAQALKEAWRVLKPGGLLVTATGFVTRDSFAQLPREVQTVLLRQRPDILEDLYADTVQAGFETIDSVICGGWDTDDDESDIADLARTLNVNLHFTSYVRFCRKGES